MKILIIKLLLTYFFIATIVLINLLFNDMLKLGRVNNKTNEFIPCSHTFVMFFSLLWIVFLPKMILKNIN